MASALSRTVWIASSTSVLVTERMASRSLTSSRPMMSALAVYSSSAMGDPLGGRPVITTIIDEGLGAMKGQLPVTLVTGGLGGWAACKAPAGPGPWSICGLADRFGHAGVKGPL